ncbi:MAG: glutamate racemase [Nitrospirae bacterium]|nr:glutamate racemase [Nitrospirota bacterium]
MKTPSDKRPIGIFDSGVGGLTVLKEVIKKLPSENIIYLGDTARVPYGARSPEIIMKYSLECAQFLLSRGIKLLVVACNTSSSISLPGLAQDLPVPVVGVVEPGARAAVAKSRSKKIAVIGTETTIKSGSYKRAIKAIDYSIDVMGLACPLFVPLVEEGWIRGNIVSLTAQKYLSPLKKFGADVLILGCTHYPIIKRVIREVAETNLIDSAAETAKEVKCILEESKVLRLDNSKPEREFFVTDSPKKFIQIGEMFLGQKISNISGINVGDLK